MQPPEALKPSFLHNRDCFLSSIPLQVFLYFFDPRDCNTIHKSTTPITISVLDVNYSTRAQDTPYLHENLTSSSYMKMASKLEEKLVSDGATSPVGSDLAVQPINTKCIVPADGPIVQAGNSSVASISSAFGSDASSVAEVAVSESYPAVPIVVDAVVNDAVDKNTVDVSVEPEDTHKTIASQDDDDLEEISELTPAVTTVVDTKIDNTANKDIASVSLELATTQDINNATSGPVEPEATQDIITKDRDDDLETVFEPAAAASTMIHAKNDGTVGKDVALGCTEPDATRDVGPAEAPKPTGSVPPHLRPSSQSSAIPQSRYADVPRAPRNNYANNSLRGFNGREEVARLSAQMMKVRNELDAERKKSANMRASIEQEVQNTTDNALARLTTELFHKQVKTLTQQGKLEAKERELLFRQAQIEQTEIFLSEGQKQVYRQANMDDDDVQEGALSMAEVNREYERRQAELVAQNNVSDREGQMSIRDKALQLREAAQMMREQQYKALIRGALEAERRENAMPNMDAKLEEVADVEYNRGFGAGKVAGRAAADKGAHDQSFLEGYSAARRAEVALNKLKMGTMARDSPELDFLYNSSHPYNLFAMGARIGSVDFDKQKSLANGMVNQGEKKPAETITYTQGGKKTSQEQKRPEEAVRRLPPARPTFASELRVPSNMHNGQPVLANGSATSPPIDSVYEGRKVIKYEDVQGDSLIDLY
ncbi:hypothetical protein HBH98_219660 [Parastagonospora nodorum]|nr:hypothetical protein HBH43_227000 [Parastagonospora nodorum]KAH4251932.1 hypothetical protein HBI03_217600 [Parastagonospora nodorum]KAH4258715.1 hypothetical protein HBI04_215920 [Parastagonospora nodorum]KAH4337679.1 hypothetical protein HBH98_219660 [Parastagonospora nodorum]KAH4360286.1 hypothetical protein HBH97_207790 [Parastagonospora nodorum]